MNILITCFKQFNILDSVFGNPSERAGKKLSKEFKTDLLIMDVNTSCLSKLDNQLREKKYDLVFMLGEGDGFRVETETSKGEISEFAKKIKEKLRLELKENIGTYFCDKVYSFAIKRNKKVIFIHLPLFYNHKKLKQILMECIWAY